MLSASQKPLATLLAEIAPLLLMLPAIGCGVASHGLNVEGARLYDQGNYQAATQRFQQAIANDPTNPDGYYNMGSTLHRIGKQTNDRNLLAQAETYYNQCLDKADDKKIDHTDCYRALTVLLAENGRPDASMRLLESWVMKNPTSADAKIELARFMDEMGNREIAKQRLLEALASEPNNTRALTALAKIREDEGNPVQAMQIYERSLALNRFQPQVASRLASLQTSVGHLAAPTTLGETRVVSQPVQWNRY